MSSKFFRPEDCDVGEINYGFIQSPRTISLDKANRLLEERGRVVYGKVTPDGHGWDFDCREFPRKDQNHRALLINIEPLETEDSAESFLCAFKKYLDALDCGYSEVNDIPKKWNELKEQARVLLAKKGE